MSQLTLVLGQMLKRAARYKEKIALLFIDLDHFKSVNDTFGHAVGDILLKKIAERLCLNTRASDIVARIGGDEFVIGLDNSHAIAGIKKFITKLIQCITQPILIDQHEISIHASIGISIFPDQGETIQTLLKNADSAMYLAKELGRNQYQFFMQHDL